MFLVLFILYIKKKIKTTHMGIICFPNSSAAVSYRIVSRCDLIQYGVLLEFRDEEQRSGQESRGHAFITQPTLL